MLMLGQVMAGAYEGVSGDSQADGMSFSASDPVHKCVLSIACALASPAL